MRASTILEKLSTEELVGQLLCFDFYGKDDPKEIERVLRDIKPGGIFLQQMTAEQVKMYTEMANKYSSVPVIVAGEIEGGANKTVIELGSLPNQMAFASADDTELLKKLGVVLGDACRKSGIHWAYAPVVDINYNFMASICNVRCFSDSPKHVVKMAKAFVEGLEHNHNLVACCKHFPGEGVDDRNSHFMTTVNTLSKEEWMSTYGYIYKEMINAGVSTIMAGHVALPAYETECDPIYGYPPAVFSKSILTDLLKGELGFDGCIVSDAMSMIGASACVRDLKEISLKFLRAGGDMILFPEDTDYQVILDALKNGELEIERVKDAVRRILKLKEKANLFGDYPVVEESYDQSISEIAQSLADKSIRVIRDYDRILPLKMKKGGKVLVISVLEPYFQKPPTGKEFDAFIEEFEKEGYQVDLMINPKHKELQPILDDYEAVLVNCKMSSEDYHGATLRIGWNNVMVFWRAYVLQHPNFVFTSFGDPYKLYDAPYLKTYINAYSGDPTSQRAAAKVLLGKLKPQGKNPVAFKGFFEREVD